METEINRITERLENGNLSLSEAQKQLLELYKSGISDLNHIVINSCMNISALSMDDLKIQDECGKIIDCVRNFSKNKS
jgi:uncharacterized membrane protein YjjP (DUF1212 family)